MLLRHKDRFHPLVPAESPAGAVSPYALPLNTALARQLKVIFFESSAEKAPARFERNMKECVTESWAAQGWELTQQARLIHLQIKR